MALSFKAFLKNTSGGAAVWAALTAPFLIGGAALSVDSARIYSMDGDLQSAADALARAGAAELDQRPDSLTRSDRAIRNLLTLEQRFSDRGAGDVEIGHIRFLKTVPSKDYEDIPSSSVTTKPSEANYVEVTLKPEKVTTLFPVKFVSNLTHVNMNASAVAGLDQTVCGVAPVFVCNPYEGLTVDIYAALEDPHERRRQIQFKANVQNNTRLAPGAFGWLDPYGGNSGASKLADDIAIDKPAACLSKRAGVILRSGNISSMRHGFNTRFDIYSGSFKKKKSDPRYAPAENVVKGYSSKNSCSASPDPLAFGLARDDCYLTGSCSNGHSQIGTGNWDFMTYMRLNHNSPNKVTIKSVEYKMNYAKNTFTPANPPSRYDLYRWEIDSSKIPGKSTYGNKAASPEEGMPQCHSSGPSITVDDRRIIHAAVLNCNFLEAQFDSGALSKSDPLPVETFVKVFVTEPMGVGNDATIWGEMVSAVIEGKDGEARDQVTIVR